MKNQVIILLLLISTIAYGQSDTLVMESVITVRVVKKTMVEKTVNGRRVTDVTQEETIASEELLFKDKKAPRVTERRAFAKRPDRSRPSMVETKPPKSGLGVSVVPSGQVRSSEEVIVPQAPKMGDYYFPVIDEASRFANTITATDLEKHAMILASDEYEGRETGKSGQQKAAEYIANHFKALGLPDLAEGKTYYQTYPLKGEAWEADGIKIKK